MKNDRIINLSISAPHWLIVLKFEVWCICGSRMLYSFSFFSCLFFLHRNLHLLLVFRSSCNRLETLTRCSVLVRNPILFCQSDLRLKNYSRIQYFSPITCKTVGQPTLRHGVILNDCSEADSTLPLRAAQPALDQMTPENVNTLYNSC